jgi:hypothetical protein
MTDFLVELRFEVVAPGFAIKPGLDQLQHRFPREVIDLRKNGQSEWQPDDFVHKGATRLAPTSEASL